MQSINDSGSSAFAYLPNDLFFCFFCFFCVGTGISVPCFLQKGNDTLPVTIVTVKRYSLLACCGVIETFDGTIVLRVLFGKQLLYKEYTKDELV